MEVNRVGRKTHDLEDLRDRRGYLELNEEATDRKRWRGEFKIQKLARNTS